MVADGMGGENHGEVASNLTAEYFVKFLSPFIVDDDATIPFEYTDEDYFINVMIHAAEAANHAVIDYARENQSHRGMGSTLTSAVYHQSCLYVSHIGDSRLYCIREGNIQQITEDHTRVYEMVKQQLITSEEARSHPQRHVITRCIGRKRQFQPDVFSIDVSKTDIFLICSDGLHDMIEDKDIHRIIVQSEDFKQACQRLIETANEKGGIDNITVVLFQLLNNNE